MQKLLGEAQYEYSATRAASRAGVPEGQRTLACLLLSRPGEQESMNAGLSCNRPCVHLLGSSQIFQWLGDSCGNQRKIPAVPFHICCQEAKLCGAHTHECEARKTAVWRAQLCPSQAGEEGGMSSCHCSVIAALPMEKLAH